MRPPIATASRADLPRWRNRRAADVRELALVYSGALLVYFVILAFLCFAPGGLARRGGGFTAAILMVFAGVAHIVIGGAVVALTARRLAYWNGPTRPWIGGRWIVVILWPIAVAAALTKLVNAPWR